MKSFDVSRLPATITLGYDGENNWRPNQFNCSSLLENHPNGTISLWLLPHGETQAFPVALERDGDSVVWTPRAEEMPAATGALQFVCTDGTDVGKSAVVLFRVDESILPGAEHPADVPSWATQTVARAEAAAKRAEEAAESIDIEHLEQSISAAVEAYLIEHPVQAPVQSVNNKTGAVVLSASDVGAMPSSYVAPVTSVNGQTGDVVIPTGGNVDSVNGKTGVVNLSASDVHALPDSTVIPVVPQMATQADMSDWTSGKTVDAAVLKADFQGALQALKTFGDAVDYHTSEISNLQTGKADKTEVPAKTSDLTNDSGYQTAQDVQTAIAAIPDELPTVTATDNGKSLVVENGAWGKGYQAARTPRVAMASTDTTPTLDPNKLYVFPKMATLTPTFTTPTDNTIVNEYHFVFDSGATATVLTLPASILQPDGFTVEANTHYEISILEGAMTAQGWAVTV